MTFFGQIDPQYLPVPDDGNIEVIPFLEASKQILPFFGKLGKTFGVIQSDVNGNVTKIHNRQQILNQENGGGEKSDNLKTFRQLLEEDIRLNYQKNDKSTCVSLLWLKRGMDFICRFLQSIVDDTRSGKKSESLKTITQNAYEQTLKMHHNWMVRQVFSLVSHAAPWRADLIKILCNGNESLEDECINDMENYTKILRPNVDNLDCLLKDLKIEVEDKD
ncbi:unnamed protein product [Owenia fusiformis]|uniref:Uncharacterized protein n=1 Tax=Owenia fusiformis TaxID=6347 RepID=A0A8J1XN14_OWEFU|nr:unnamed protein product [Owenia fusiformis]